MTFREQLKTNYQKKERHLQERKERLYLQRDVSKWGCTPPERAAELKENKEKILASKGMAFSYMLTQDTEALNNLREEMNYVTN